MIDKISLNFLNNYFKIMSMCRAVFITGHTTNISYLIYRLQNI